MRQVYVKTWYKRSRIKEFYEAMFLYNHKVPFSLDTVCVYMKKERFYKRNTKHVQLNAYV